VRHAPAPPPELTPAEKAERLVKEILAPNLASTLGSRVDSLAAAV